MANTVRLTVLTGPHKNRKYYLRGPARSLVGRGVDCFVQFAGQPQDLSISRHHCELDIDGDPLQVRVRDLGSLNGTFLNGRKVVSIPRDRPELAAESGGQIVNHGDLLTLNGATLMIEIVDVPIIRHDEPVDSLGSAGENLAKDQCRIHC